MQNIQNIICWMQLHLYQRFNKIQTIIINNWNTTPTLVLTIFSSVSDYQWLQGVSCQCNHYRHIWPNLWRHIVVLPQETAAFHVSIVVHRDKPLFMEYQTNGVSNSVWSYNTRNWFKPVSMGYYWLLNALSCNNITLSIYKDCAAFSLRTLIK